MYFLLAYWDELNYTMTILDWLISGAKALLNTSWLFAFELDLGANPVHLQNPAPQMAVGSDLGWRECVGAA